MELDPQAPLGVFDSGLGGLTVVRQIRKLLPHEKIIYFGDTARVPYGTKSRETVIRFSLQIGKFLEEKGVKVLVVACNTASAMALMELRVNLAIPVIGVIEPGAMAAVKASKFGNIGVIGTTSTINSRAYDKWLEKLSYTKPVFSQACPLFVPLVEEGWHETKPAYLIAREYLKPLKKQYVDTLILGCTHYPILKAVIRKVMGKEVKIIDSAVETARILKMLLSNSNQLNDSEENGEFRIYVSDLPQKFTEIATRFLGEELPDVIQYNFD